MDLVPLEPSYCNIAQDTGAQNMTWVMNWEALGKRKLREHSDKNASEPKI
jgi:hypothetical protein